MTNFSLAEKEEKSEYAVLLIDVINDLEFPGNEELLELAPVLAGRLFDLKQAARARKIPVIYVNDNFGKWRSNFNELLDHCSSTEVGGCILAHKLKPNKSDYFVLKPMHSGFYCTPLEILLEHLGVTKLILAGLAGNICVLYTANDAYMRGYNLFVASDCTMSNTASDNEYALNHMRNLLKAEVVKSEELFQIIDKRHERG